MIKQPDRSTVMIEQLGALRDALANLGIPSEVDEASVWPRLRVHPPQERPTPSSEFDNSIVVMSVIWFSWPWCEVIGRVEDPEESASCVADTLTERSGLLS